MELRTWAEQLLLGDSLGAKLVDPGILQDRAPGPPLALPAAPGRPTAWSFSDERLPFPGSAELRDDRARGVMLHFFANHELLAIELLALGLLRFPDAPRRFRVGLARTITEEQTHLQLYLERMRQLGVQPGEVPVNSFFWDTVSGCEQPIDLCVRMGLVLEQANLDFCLHYATVLRRVGDEQTAAILDRVLHDEIGHVQHGLHWFRRWKEPGLSDWDAFVARLDLPLSPSRAKGKSMDRGVRQRVGLDPDFIDRLDVYGRSKGRPPRVWWWNPDCEAERLGPDHRASPAVTALTRDLAALPWVFASPEDLVLVPDLPRLAWLQHLRSAGFQLPELATVPGQRALGEFQPWGWSPRADAFFQRLLSQQVASAARPRPDDRAFRKDAAATWLADWGSDLGGTACTTWEAVEEAARSLADRGWSPAVKPVLSTAGQGILRRVEEAAVRHLLQRQPAVLVVPWLDKQLDLSLHFDLDGERPRQRGFTLFQADARGAWRRTLVGRPEHLLAPEQLRFLHGQHPKGLPGLGRDLSRFLAPRLAALGVQGPVGIDMLVGRDPGGQRRLHPLVEINPRWTMGRVALALRPRVAPSATAWLSLVRKPKAELSAPGLDGQGRLLSGDLWLTDPQDTAVAAVVEIQG